MHNYKDNFPIFNRIIHEKPIIFLDSAASAQKPQSVIDSMVDVMTNHYANINRGVYTLSEEATERVESARIKVAQFIGAYNHEIIFTRNATESINLVAYSWARHNLKRGDVVVISEMEHHANIVPWQILRDEIGILIEWIPVDENGNLAWLSIRESLKNEPVKLVSVTHVSNVLGTINPIKDIVSWAHSIGAKVLIDGSQAVTNVSVDVNESDCDWYVFSGHKLYGPTGVGVLYGKKDLLNSMPPFTAGGDMILEVTKERSIFKEAPWKFEAGTPAIVEIIGLGAAIDFITEIGMDTVREHALDLLQYAYPKLLELNQLCVYGPSKMQDKTGVLAFTMEGIHPHDIASVLDEEGIAIRSGHHCAQPLCDRYGQSAMARASFGVYNSKEDIDALVSGLQKVRSIFK